MDTKLDTHPRVTTPAMNLHIPQVIADHAWTVVVVLIFSVISTLATHAYIYPHSDHTITLPFLKNLLNPSLYTVDYILPEQSQHYTVFWYLISAIIQVTGVSIPALFFALYATAITATYLAVHQIAMQLFGRRDVAVLALFFMAFSQHGLAGSALVEQALLLRTVATPILLYALYACLGRNFVVSYGLLGVAFLIHPLSTAYVLAFITPVLLWQAREIGWQRAAMSIGLFIVLATPIIVWRVVASTGDGAGLLYADPQWLDILRFRSSHHVFPLSWDRGDIIKAALLLGVFVISWRHPPRNKFHHRAIMVFTGVTLLMFVVGTVFTEFLPVSLVVQVQLFRSSAFLFYFPLIYYAHYFVVTMQQSDDPYDSLLAASIAIAIFSIWDSFAIFYIVFIALALAWVGIKKLRTNPTRFGTMAGSLQFDGALMAVIIGLSILLGVRTYFVADPAFSVQNGDQATLVAAQDWARTNTPIDALFIVPPDAPEFRVDSERAIFTSYKDGTLTFFNPGFGDEWLARMDRLGFQPGDAPRGDYDTLTTSDFQQIAVDYAPGAAYVLRGTGTDDLDLDIAYQNADYVVYRVEG